MAVFFLTLKHLLIPMGFKEFYAFKSTLIVNLR